MTPAEIIKLIEERRDAAREEHERLMRDMKIPYIVIQDAFTRWATLSDLLSDLRGIPR